MEFKLGLEEGFKLLVFGVPGAGKTKFLGTAQDVPKLCPILWLDFDGGTASISKRCVAVNTSSFNLKMLKDHVPLADKINVIRLRRGDYEKLEEITFWLSQNPKAYKTLVIDSLSEVNDAAIDYCIKKNTNIKRGDGPDQKKVPVPADYKIVENNVRNLLVDLRDTLAMHVLASCFVHDEKKKNEATGMDTSEIIATVPALVPAKLRNKVAAYFDVVTYLYSDTSGDRYFVFQPKGVVQAKTRDEDGALGKQLKDTSIKEILEKLHGKTH